MPRRAETRAEAQQRRGRGTRAARARTRCESRSSAQPSFRRHLPHREHRLQSRGLRHARRHLPPVPAATAAAAAETSIHTAASRRLAWCETVTAPVSEIASRPRPAIDVATASRSLRDRMPASAARTARPPAAHAWTRESGASVSATTYRIQPPIPVQKPTSQRRLPKSEARERSGRRNDSAGSAAAAPCWTK